MSCRPGKTSAAIVAEGMGKCYHLYPRPADRLKQTLWRGRRKFYQEFWALRDVSFTVHPGETVAVIGRNGSGKSTLLQILAGTLLPTVGRARVVGNVAALLELGSGFNPEFTGRENVFTNGAILGLREADVHERFEDIAAFAEIGEFIDQPVKMYSSGMLLRLAFAVQAQVNPDVIIIDEALAVGDEPFQRKCYARLDELRSQGTAVLLATHAMTVVERYSDRAILLDRGAVHGVGSSKQIIDQYHALLYADESAYLRMLTSAGSTDKPSEKPAPPPVEEPSQALSLPPKSTDATSPETSRVRALIAEVWMTDTDGRRRDFFDSGQEVEIGFSLVIQERIPAIKAGIRIKTVEGIEVHGTSTDYHEEPLVDVPAGCTCRARFRMNLALCEGTYFVSVAAAEIVSEAEMLYLDKRTDVLMFRVGQCPLTSTGIAALNSRVTFEVSDRHDGNSPGTVDLHTEPEEA